MKRIFALLLAASLLILCGCAKEDPYPETVPETTTEATTEATTEPSTVEPTEEVKVTYTHPLTGEALDTLYTGRPVGVVINNLKACLPQYGISEADMIYEFEVEGSITRFLAIFSDVGSVKTIGPIRSTRTYFNNVCTSYGIPTVHCGGSTKALDGMYDDTNKLSKWVHIDQMSNGKYFYRDKDRQSSGYAFEHTLFTTGDKLYQAMEDKGMNTVTENGTDYGLQFAQTPDFAGEAATKVTVTFRAKKTTQFTYNTQTGLYEAYQLKQNHIDANTGKTLSYRNLIALQAEQWISGSYARTYYDMIGEGTGYFACDGKIIPIKWSRAAVDQPFSYTLEDGTPLTLGVGRTYVGIYGNTGSAKVTFE